MRPPDPAWRVAMGGLLVASLAIVALYFQGFASFVAVWSSTVAYRFLFLIPVIFVYLLWVRWPDIAALTPRPSALGLLYGAPFGALWLVAQATQLSVAAQVAAIGMLQAVFLTLLGWSVTKRLLFPLLLLWLMVPFGDLLIPVLIELTTTLTIGALQLAGLPAASDGNLLIAGGARYAIIQECSGLDFLLGNLLVSLVFANLIYQRTRKQVAYVLAGLAVAILANNLRTTSVILITASGFDLASNHEAYGWFVFLLAMLLQMAVGLRYQDDAAAPATGRSASSPPATLRTLAAACSIVALAGLAPAYAHFALDTDTTPVAVRLCLPPGLRPAPGPVAEAVAWHPGFPTADARLRRALDGGDRPVDLFVAYYWRQAPGRKLIAWDNRLHDGKQWRYMASGIDRVELAGFPLDIGTERQAGPSGQRRLVWYWYWVDGRFSHRPWEAKLLQAWAELGGGDRRSAVIALAADELVAGDLEPARSALQTALEQLPWIADVLDSGAPLRTTRKKAAREIPGRDCP